MEQKRETERRGLVESSRRVPELCNLLSSYKHAEELHAVMLGRPADGWYRDRAGLVSMQGRQKKKAKQDNCDIGKEHEQ